MVPDEAPRQNVKLEEIMKPAVSVSADAPAREALKIMREHNLPGVPVVGEGGKLEGFITDGQLMASALPQYMKFMHDLSFVPESADQWVHYLADAADRPVREVMVQEVSQVELGKSELAVAHKMVRDGVSSVVITHEAEEVGIVNRLDLYAAIEGID